ncbi:MAG: RNA polymerase sigma factor [Bacteroidia bacterium]|nr:RNA polymerase sigma factor [Bacteroidia bacterium]
MKSDEELIKGCIREDRHMQGLLYQKYADKMFAVCLRYSNSREEAEDVLQEAFIKIFDKISKFRQEGSFEGWMRRIMVNTALRSWDKRARKFEPGNLDDITEPAQPAHVLDGIGAKEIMQMIRRLPEGYKVVFNLFAVEGYSHKEIGELLNINESTSRSQYARARKNLMQMIEKIES